MQNPTIEKMIETAKTEREKLLQQNTRTPAETERLNQLTHLLRKELKP